MSIFCFYTICLRSILTELWCYEKSDICHQKNLRPRLASLGFGRDQYLGVPFLRGLFEIMSKWLLTPLLILTQIDVYAPTWIFFKFSRELLKANEIYTNSIILESNQGVTHGNTQGFWYEIPNKLRQNLQIPEPYGFSGYSLFKTDWQVQPFIRGWKRKVKIFFRSVSLMHKRKVVMGCPYMN